MKKKEIRPFYDVLFENAVLPEFDEFIAKLKESGHHWISGLTGSSKALFLSHFFQRSARPLLVVENDVDSAENMVDDLVTFLGEDRVSYVPDWEIMPYEGRSPHEGVLGARLDAFYQMQENQQRIWVTTVKALMRKTPSPTYLQESIIRLKKSGSYDLSELKQRFVEIGYRREKKVEDLNTFAVRGDILDFFTYAQRNPVRVEFWGDSIDDIRLFDIYTQRSIHTINEVVILPAAEMTLQPRYVAMGLKTIEQRKKDIEKSQTRYHDAFEGKDEFELEDEADRMLDLVDGDPDLVIDKLREKIPFEGQEEYFPYFIPEMTSMIHFLPTSACIVVDERTDVQESASEFWKLIQNQYAKTSAMRRPMPDPEQVFFSPEQLNIQWQNRLQIDMTLMHLRPPVDEIQYHQRMDMKSQTAAGGHLDQAAESLRELIRDGYQITVFADNRGQLERLKQLLEDIPY